MKPLMGFDLEGGVRGQQERANESIALVGEHALSESTRVASTSFTLLDVRHVAAELMASDPLAHDSSAARTLVDDADMTVSIIALKRGGRLREHASPHAAVIAPIFGRVRFATGNGIVDLSPGRFMFVDRDRLHEIVADEDSALMLVTAREPLGAPLRAAIPGPTLTRVS